MEKPTLTSLETFCNEHHPEVIEEWNKLREEEQKKLDEYEEEQRQIRIKNRLPLYGYSFYFDVKQYGWDEPSEESISFSEFFQNLLDFDISVTKDGDDWFTFEEFIDLSEYNDEKEFFNQWIDGYIYATESTWMCNKLGDMWDGKILGVTKCDCTKVYTSDEMRDFFRKCYYKDLLK